MFDRPQQRILWTVVSLALVAALAMRIATAQRSAFDHMTTGFELQGAHRDVSCESCHVGAMFKGTPRTCTACHTMGSRFSASPKPANHVMTSERCDACHTQDAFMPVLFMQHTEVRGACFTCHNGTTATGKN